MATATDLMGLGTPGALANYLGFSVQTVTTTASTQGSSGGVLRGVNIIALATPAAGDGAVTLPASAPIGNCVVVVNMDGSNSLDLFPPSGESIHKLSANVGTALATGETAVCFKISTTVWSASKVATPAAT